MTLKFSQLWPYADLLLWGAAHTLAIMALCGSIGFAVAVLLAEVRRAGPAPLRWMVATYVEIIRDTPFIIQLFVVYIGLPGLGLRLDPWTAGLIALTLNICAYFTEIIRAGLVATPNGQFEAARALGLPRLQIFLKIVLPPALARVYSPLVSQFVLVFLGSAVISQISVEELTYQAQFIQSRSFLAFETFLVTAGLYIVTSYACRFGLMRLEPLLFPWARAGQR